MSLEKKRPEGIDILKLKKMKVQEMMITETPSPSAITCKKRISKLTNRKTNEQIIKESHDQLMTFAGSINGKVEKIIQLYEAEFLEAYREHVKKVREEMEELKKRAQSCNSEDKLQQKIDLLEKQLTIFREDSLTSYQKTVKKDKQIALLTSKLKDTQREIKEKDSIIKSLSRKNKELEVIIDRFKLQNQDLAKEVQKDKDRTSKSQNKNYKDLYSPISNQFLLSPNQRPFSTQLKSNRINNLTLRLESQKKYELSQERQDLKMIKQKLYEKAGGNQMVPINTVLDIITQNNQSQAKRNNLTDFRKARSSYMSHFQSKKCHNLYIDCEDLKKKSKQFSEGNELRTIFKNCVEEVRTQMIRKKGIPSLNFFKQNGPKSYQQFKKVDYFTLIEVFIGKEAVLKALYQLIFTVQQ